MKSLQRIIRWLFESKMSIHIAFIVFFLVMFFLPAVVNGLPGAKLSKVFLYATFLLLCMYSGRLCCRRWLLLNEFKKFVAYSCVAIVLFSIIGIIGLMFFTKNSTTAILVTILSVVVLFFSLGLFFSITRATILRQLKEALIVQEQKDSELRLLKSQLSPHFLFNVLNNLYGLSLKRDDKVPNMILKLSDLLRYSLYDTSSHFVSLQSELDCIENYIELEKMRIGTRLALELNLSGEKTVNVLIVPMVLMVFIENAFKHSTNTKQSSAIIKIDFRLIDDWMELDVKNNIPGEVKQTFHINKSSGIGLSVTKKRLELLYPNKYSLKTSSINGFYEINLKIKVK